MFGSLLEVKGKKIQDLIASLYNQQQIHDRSIKLLQNNRQKETHRYGKFYKAKKSNFGNTKDKII
jgi:hypothetical protein